MGLAYGYMIVYISRPEFGVGLSKLLAMLFVFFFGELCER